MARTLIVEVAITVNDDEQAAKIYAAVANGLAETAIKDRVLYGMNTVAAAPATFAPSAAKAAEAAVQLKAVETRKPITAPEALVEKPKERTRGILGRRRVERQGGK